MKGDALGVRCRELNPCEKDCLRGRIVFWNAVEKAGKKRASEKEKKYEFFFSEAAYASGMAFASPKSSHHLPVWCYCQIIILYFFLDE